MLEMQKRFVQHNSGSHLSHLGLTRQLQRALIIQAELLGSHRHTYRTSQRSADSCLSSSADRTSQPGNADLLGVEGAADAPPKYSELEISQDGLDTKARVTGSLPRSSH